MRVATDEDIGTQITGQLFTNPRVLNITGAIIVLMGLIPGMPHFAFLALGGGAIWLARTQTKRAAARKAAGDLTDIAPPAVLPSDSHEATWDDVQLIDPLGLEVGYRLIPLVDKNSDGELLKRIKSIRKKFAQEIGFLPPVIHIRDNLELRPNAYRIALKGVEIGVGEVFRPVARDQPRPGDGRAAGRRHAGSRVRAAGRVDRRRDARAGAGVRLHGGRREHGRRDAPEPSGRPARGRAARPPGSAVAHRAHRQDAPSLVEDLVPKTISLTTLQKVLQNLLEEGVPIRDMRTILEAVSEHAGRGDAFEITAAVRLSLGRAITQQWYPGAGEMQVMGLDSNLERVLSQALATGANRASNPASRTTF